MSKKLVARSTILNYHQSMIHSNKFIIKTVLLHKKVKRLSFLHIHNSIMLLY